MDERSSAAYDEDFIVCKGKDCRGVDRGAARALTTNGSFHAVGRAGKSACVYFRGTAIQTWFKNANPGDSRRSQENGRLSPCAFILCGCNQRAWPLGFALRGLGVGSAWAAFGFGLAAAALFTWRSTPPGDATKLRFGIGRSLSGLCARLAAVPFSGDFCHGR